MSDLAKILEGIREGHHQAMAYPDFCECGDSWPCDATKLLDALEVAIEALSKLAIVRFPSNALEPVPWYAKQCEKTIAAISEKLR